MVNTSDSGPRGRGFEPHSGRRVVSLSKTYLPQKTTGNTQEALAPSQHEILVSFVIQYAFYKNQIMKQIVSFIWRKCPTIL